MTQEFAKTHPEYEAAVDASRPVASETRAGERLAHLQTLIEGMSDAAFLKDREGRYLLVNRAAAGALGRQPADFLGRDAYSLFAPEIADAITRKDREILASGRPSVFEEEFLINGEVRQLQSLLNVCRDVNGQISGLVGISRDITDLKRLEAELRQREQELKEAHRIAKLGTWRWHRTTGTVTWSEEVYRTFGRNPALPPPRYEELRNYHTPESWSRLEAAVARAIATGEPYELDLQIVMLDGSCKWITARGEAESFSGSEATRLRGTIQEITERKRREEQLALSESRYRSLVHASSNIVWSASADGKRHPEPDWCAFTGQKLEEVAESGGRNAIHPDDREYSFRAWEQQVAAGEMFEIKHRVKRYDGIYRNMQARAVPVRDAAGNILEWIGMHTDITEQTIVEEALHRSQSQFRKLFESGMIGIGIPNRFGGFTEGNNELLRLTGYSREDMDAGRVRWDTMTPLEYGELDKFHIAEAAQRGNCTPYEKEYIRKDGSRVPILCGYALLEGSQDEYIGFVLDLTPLKQAEAALREREQRFSALAESLPQLVWATDAEGRNTYANQRFRDYIGLPLGEIMDLRWERLIHPDDLDSTLEKWQSCLQSGEPYLNEYRLRRHDGTYRYFLARAVPARNETGQIDRWLGSSTDMHDQKLAEEALRRSEKLAATGRLAASVAHEINNPLNAVTNTLYLALQDPALHPKTREYLVTADLELARVAQVATQTLRFHKQSTAPTPTDLSEVMESVFSLFGPRLRACGITVKRDYISHDKLYCFSAEIRQVFANLIGNAMDAITHGGELTVRIRYTQSHPGDSGRGIKVIVADTGEGIPASIRDRIFEPFVTSKEMTGTGLGLWVSEEIVRKHRGKIRFRTSTSAAHHGTVFSLYFPLDGTSLNEQLKAKSSTTS